MTVIKMSGRKEEFSPKKLMKSIVATCNELGLPLDEEMLREVLQEFERIVRGKNLITTRQINVIINGLLYSKGRHEFLEHRVASYH